MNRGMEREALVVVKTYPNISTKYYETVCVAAITKEEGLIRLYPIKFRQMEEERRFKKYHVIRFRMEKHKNDPRPESYRPDEASIEICDHIPSDAYHERWRWIRPVVGPTMCELLRLQRSQGTSLGCVKVARVERFLIEETDEEWPAKKKAIRDQLRLFDVVKNRLERIPFIFKYRYYCEEQNCRGHTQTIFDWEIMQLYRNLKNKGDSKEKIKEKIRQKFVDQLCDEKYDTHFFVGTHSRWRRSFMVLGVFWPRKDKQKLLFE